MINKVRQGQRLTNSKSIGNLSEMKVMTRLIELGHKVSIPYGDNCRYDLILDLNGTLQKIQIKTGRYKDGCVVFETRSVNKIGGCYQRNNYKNQVHYFIIYCPQLNQLYIIDPNELSNTSGRLRVDPPKRTYLKNIIWAKDHIL